MLYTKEQLVERLVIVYDELVKVSALKRDVELKLKNETELFEKMIDRYVEQVKKICDIKGLGKKYMFFILSKNENKLAMSLNLGYSVPKTQNNLSSFRKGH